MTAGESVAGIVISLDDEDSRVVYQVDRIIARQICKRCIEVEAMA